MTVPQIKVKVQRRPQIKLKVLPKFPASVTVEDPILLDTTGGNYEFSIDIDSLVTSIGIEFDDRYSLVRDYDTVAAVGVAYVPSGTAYIRTGGYAAVGDGGSGFYKHVSAGPASLYLIQSADGAWWELETAELNVLQLGADPTETDFSDAAFQAIDNYLTAHDDCRKVIIPPGRYKVFEATTPGTNISTLVTLSGTSFTGVSFEGHGATLVIDMPNYDDSAYSDTTKANYGSVFQFTNVPDVKFVLNFEGDLTTTLVNTATSQVGFIGLVLLGTCHNADVEISATGIMMPCFIESSADVYFELDGTEMPLIEAGGAGYAVNDTVAFVKDASYGASRNAVITVTAVNAGVVTAISVTDLGRFEYDGSISGDNAVPRIDVTDLGFPTTTLTGAGSGLLVRPFFRVGNREMLPRNQRFKLTAETCCRIGTIGGAGAEGPTFTIDGNHIQRAILVQNDVSYVTIRGRIENSWLNCIELLHYVCTPSHVTIDIDHEPTEGLNTTGWINNSTTLVHDTQAAGPSRFYVTRAVIRKVWPEYLTANGQSIWYPNAVSGVSAFATEQQDRRHRIRDFDLRVTCAGYPSNSGTLASPIVVGLPDPGSGWAPYEALDIAGMKVSGYLGPNAKCDLATEAFQHDLPNLEGLTATSHGSQVLIDSSSVPQQLGGDPARATQIVAGVGGNVTTIYTDNSATGPVVLTYHNSASPAVADVVAYHLEAGNNSAAALTWYGGYSVSIVDPTAASEDGYLSLYGKVAGTLTEAMRVSSGVYTPNVGSAGANTLHGGSGVYDTNNRVWSSSYTTAADARYAKLTSNTFVGSQTIQINDDTASPPAALTLFYNSTSPAVSDNLYTSITYGKNSAAANVIYSGILTSIISPTAAAEASELQFVTISAGATSTQMSVRAGAYMAGATGGDLGAGTFNAVRHYAGDGTVAAPAFAFNGDTDNGGYRIGANNWALSAGGTKVLEFTASEVRSIMPVGAPDGTLAAPGWTFTSDLNTGAYRIANNNFALVAGGVSAIDMTSTAVTIPLATTINNDLTVSSGSVPLNVKRVASTTAGPRMNLVLDNSGGTPAVNDVLGTYGYRGRSSTGVDIDYGGFRMDCSDPTNGSHDGFLRFTTAVAGSVGSRLIVANGAYTPSATGGDQGADSINAKAVYDDAVLLCAPIEHARTGFVDNQKWDALAPFGSHRKFKKMLDEGFDPSDPRKFVDRMMADSAVPGLFTEAEHAKRHKEGGKKVSIGEARERMYLAIDNIGLALAGLVKENDELKARLEKLEAS